MLDYGVLTCDAHITQTERGKPVVYVGKTAHGSFHDALEKQIVGLQSCAYFGDLRGDDGVSWDTGTAPLVELTVWGGHR